jgi:tetratricopeptide (TPR) repeat protein
MTESPNPPSTDAEIRRALAAGRIDDAVAAASSRLAACPDDPESWLLAGLAALAADDLGAAIERLAEAARRAPHAVVVHVNLAEARRRAGELDAAVASARTAVALDAGHALAWHNLGAALFDRREWADAADAYARSIAQVPTAAACANRGDCLRELGRIEAAVAAYRDALAHAPDHVHAHANLGPLLVAIGEAEAGIEHCRRAVALAPDDADAWQNLAICLHELERVDEAMDAYAEAWSLAPTRSALALRIAACFQLAGDLAAAAAWLDTAGRLAPDDDGVQLAHALLMLEGGHTERALASLESLAAQPAASVAVLSALATARWDDGDVDGAITAIAAAQAASPGLARLDAQAGEILASAGRMEDAVAALRAARARNPADLHALAGLASVLRGSLAADELDAAEALLAADWPGDGARSALHNGLAHHYDAAGDYARAGVHAEASARLQQTIAARRGIGDVSGAFAARVDGLIAAFGPDTFARLGHAGCDDERPVFVVGMPRSGTTLTEQILAAHPSVLGIGERPFAARAASWVGQACGGQVERLDADILAGAAALHRAELDKLAARCPSPPMRIVDKMPDNYLQLGLIALMFPRARLIHVRRDPRDIAVSCWFQRFRRLRWADRMEGIAERLLQHDRIMAHWRAVLPVPLFEFDYEDLVGDPAGVSRALLDFIGLPWDPRVLKHQDNASVVRTASLVQVRKPVYTSSRARWRHYRGFLGPVLAAYPDTAPAALRPAMSDSGRYAD